MSLILTSATSDDRGAPVPARVFHPTTDLASTQALLDEHGPSGWVAEEIDGHEGVWVHLRGDTHVSEIVAVMRALGDEWTLVPDPR